MRVNREIGGREKGSEAGQPKVISHFPRLLVQGIYPTAFSVVRNDYSRARKKKKAGGGGEREKTLVVCLLLKDQTPRNKFRNPGDSAISLIQSVNQRTSLSR